MSTDRVLAIAACIIAVVALALAAVAWRDGSDRDACARLADLGTAYGHEAAVRLTAPEGARDAGVALARDCLTS